MEVEHSPSFPATRSCVPQSTKRDRSPDTSTPLDRPAKRLSPAIGTTLSGPIHPLPGCLRLVASPISRNQHPSEDWVQQAGELTIESPLFCVDGTLIPHNLSEEAQNLSDENMNMDPYEIENGSPSPQQFSYIRTSPSHESLLQAPTQHSNPHMSHQVQQLQQQYRQYSVDTSSQRQASHSYLSVPAHDTSELLSSRHNGSIAPPTPAQTKQPHSSTLLSCPIDASPMNMSLSSTPSYVKVNPPLSLKKQRFTMGPRADCEKCRLGVKGHWMHLD